MAIVLLQFTDACVGDRIAPMKALRLRNLGDFSLTEMTGKTFGRMTFATLGLLNIYYIPFS
jgi:hypothetical protein